MGINSIRHQIELAIRWNECDEPLSVKLVQSDALMKLDIFKLNQFIARLFARHLK